MKEGKEGEKGRVGRKGRKKKGGEERKKEGKGKGGGKKGKALYLASRPTPRDRSNITISQLARAV